MAKVMGKKYLFLALLLFALAISAFSQSGNKGGRTGAQFLEIGVGARAVGMAESFVAVANDVSAIYFNPAGLLELQDVQVMFSNIQWPAEITYNYAAGAIPVASFDGVIGIHLAKLSTGSMIVRTQLRPEGTGETFEAANYVSGISYAQRLTDRFGIGFNVKYVRLNAFRYVAEGIAFDLGSMYKTGFESFRFGWLISNFGANLKFINESFALPTSVMFGVAAEAFETETQSLTLSLQGIRPSDNAERVSVGTEYRFMDLLRLRAGYRFNYDADRYSLGLGINVPISSIKIKFDYAYSDIRFLTHANRFSLSIAF
jgi:long-subunit fatty acid transport protein